ncbi:MAG TPA: extracellular solute-binding protein [Roseiflexaceae bacterium]|nr:extracellular solute-binding protein [Roseiflexaceae bacterium]
MQSTSIDRHAWRAARALAALLAALLVLSACAGIGAPAATPQPGATATAAGTDATSAPDATASASAVTIGFAAPEPERSAYEPLIAAFNQQNPDVHVEFVPLPMQQVQSPDQMMRQLVSAADTAATFFLRPEDIKNGLVRDLAPLIDADPQFDRDDFYPGALATGSGSSGVYMLPRTLRLALLSYNKDLWSRRGLPAPKPGWTWSDLLAAAQQLAQKRGDTVDVYGFAGGGDDGLAALGGLLTEAGVDISANVEQLRLDQPKIAQAIERLAGLVKSGAVYANPGAGKDLLKLIADQRIAMWFGMPVMIGPDVPKPAFAVGTAALPPIGGLLEGGAEGYVMSAGTAHPEAAWRWLSFLSRQEVRRPFMEAGVGDSVPARKSQAERSGYWKQLDPEATAAVQAILARGASPLAGAPGDRRAIEALGQALAAVVGGRPVAQALAEAQAALDNQVAEAQTTPTATPDTAPLVVATPEPSGPPPGATAITFNVPPFQSEQFRHLASEFNKQHPELFVQVKTTEPIRPDEGKMTLAKMAEGADCFSWPRSAAAGQISGTLDLQPLIDADAQFKLDDYPAALLAPFKRGTTLLGLPYQVRLRALTYNQSAFDAAGLSHPSASWTADDFLNAAKQLTSGQGGDKRYGYAALAEQTDDLVFFLGLLGAQIERSDRPNFTDPKVEQAVRFYLDLLRNYSPHERIQGYSPSLPLGDDAFRLIDEGRVGMWFGLSGDIMIVAVGPGEAGRQNYTRAIAPPPGADKARPDSFQTSGLYISSTSQHPELCWQWLKFLSGDVSALDDGAFPARHSVAESDTFLKRAPAGADAVYAAYRPALDRAPEASSAASDRPRLDLFWFFRAADRALQGKDLGRELADAQARTEQYLTCVGSGGAASDCAKQVDSTYDGFAGSNS